MKNKNTKQQRRNNGNRERSIKGESKPLNVTQEVQKQKLQKQGNGSSITVCKN